LSVGVALRKKSREAKPDKPESGKAAGQSRGAGRPPALSARLFSPGYDPRSVAEVDDEPISVGSIHLRPSGQADVKAWWALNSDDLVDAEMESLSCTAGCTVSIYDEVSCAELGPEDTPAFTFAVSTSCDDEGSEVCEGDSGRGHELIEGVREPRATREGGEESRARGDGEKPARGDGKMRARGDDAQAGGEEADEKEPKMLKIAVLSDGDVVLGCGRFKAQRRRGRKGGRKTETGEQTERKAGRKTETGEQTERKAGRNSDRAGGNAGRKPSRGRGKNDKSAISAAGEAEGQ